MARQTRVLQGLRAALLGGVLVCIPACSNEPSDADPPGSGVDPSKSLSALDTSDSTLLCDWASSLLGGYGHRESCPDPDLEYYAAPDQATCVSSMEFVCTATVAQYEGCLREIASDPCNGVTAFETASGCTGLRGCGTP